METQAVRGLALICDRNGMPQNWVRDDFGLTQPGESPRTFIRLLDDSSHTQGLRFLSQLKAGEPLVNWELCFSVAGEPRPLSVAGLDLGNETLIMAAKSSAALRSFCRELATSKTEPSTAYRDLLRAWDESESAGDDTAVYNDYVRMHNDLTRLQRESASRDAKLQHLSKNRILDMAAHDLRNPLNVICLLADGLADQVADRLTEEEQSSLVKIKQTALDMGRLINNILDTARSSPGLPDLQLQTGDLEQLVRDCINQIQPLAITKHISIVLLCEEELPNISADLGRIQQVIDNLLGNAIKFSPMKTRVELRLQMTPQGLLMTVCDQGPGILEDELTTIFQPFIKGTARSTQGEPGNGLGLAICVSILEAHGAKIWAENAPQTGATIKVLLPNRMLV